MNFFSVGCYNFFVIFATDLLKRIKREKFTENQISVFITQSEIFRKNRKSKFSVTGFNPVV